MSTMSQASNLKVPLYFYFKKKKLFYCLTFPKSWPHLSPIVVKVIFLLSIYQLFSYLLHSLLDSISTLTTHTMKRIKKTASKIRDPPKSAMKLI